MKQGGSRLRWLAAAGMLLLSWVLPEAIRQSGEQAFGELTAPMVSTYGQAKDLREFWLLRGRSKHELMEAGRDLARINNAYAVSQEQVAALRAEIERLERLLELPGEPAYRYEVARVSLRQQSLWWERLVIRKGLEHGLEPGQAVIYNGGVVGRVREVRAGTAVVELISSPGFRMAAIIEGSEYPVTYQGAPNAPFARPYGEVLNVPPEIVLVPGQALPLYSSRLGGIFPAGLPIGTVTALAPGMDGYFQRGEVSLPARLASLREVAVIVPIATP